MIFTDVLRWAVGRVFSHADRRALVLSVVGMAALGAVSVRADDPGFTKPPLTNPAYVANLPGKIAAQTAVGHNVNAASDPVLRLFDLSGGPPYPAGYLTSPTQRYNAASWTRAILGTVFGLAIDRFGHMYVAHSNVYVGNGFSGNGTVALPAAMPNNSGTIYRINRLTGVPTKLVNLPQIGRGSGVGNVCYDNQFNQFFATNFTDDRVYRVSQAGVVTSTFKHTTGAVVLGGAPDPSATMVYAPPLRRLWAVGKLNKRVYYSVWNNDFSNITGIGNTVWSVGIGPGGDFIPSSQQLEVTVPLFAGAGGGAGPISDLAFSADCRMLITERSIYYNNYSGAHNARGFEYAMVAGVWTLSAANTNAAGPLMGLPVGVYGTYANAAGGGAYDYAVPLPVAAQRGIFVTADAQLLSAFPSQAVYGFQGIDRVGAPGTGVGNTCFDYDAILATGDKSQQGDVELSTPAACARVVIEDLKCFSQTTPPNYLYTATITNLTGQTINTIGLSVVGGTVSPATITLGTPVPPNGTFVLPGVLISGVTAPGPICLVITLGVGPQEIFCRFTRCLYPPNCNCLSIEQLSTFCVGRTANAQIRIRNRSTSLMANVQLIPLSPGVTFTPSTFAQPGVPFSGLSTPMSFAISGAVAGQQVCFRIRNFPFSGEICETVACLVVPQCKIFWELCNPCASPLRIAARALVVPGFNGGGPRLRIVGGSIRPSPEVAAFLIEGAFQIGEGSVPVAFSQIVEAAPTGPTVFAVDVANLAGLPPDVDIACNFVITELDSAGNELFVREEVTGSKLTKADAGRFFVDTGPASVVIVRPSNDSPIPLEIRARIATFSGPVAMQFAPEPPLTLTGAGEDGIMRKVVNFVNGRGVVQMQFGDDGQGLEPGAMLSVMISREMPTPEPPEFITELLVTTLPPNCLADLVGGDGNPPADGSIDGNDFQAFLNAFASGEALGDLVGGDGNPPADGSVDGNDFQAFLNGFAAGC